MRKMYPLIRFFFCVSTVLSDRFIMITASVFDECVPFSRRFHLSSNEILIKEQKEHLPLKFEWQENTIQIISQIPRTELAHCRKFSVLEVTIGGDTKNIAKGHPASSSPRPFGSAPLTHFLREKKRACHRVRHYYYCRYCLRVCILAKASLRFCAVKFMM